MSAYKKLSVTVDGCVRLYQLEFPRLGSILLYVSRYFLPSLKEHKILFQITLAADDTIKEVPRDWGFLVFIETSRRLSPRIIQSLQFRKKNDAMFEGNSFRARIALKVSEIESTWYTKFLIDLVCQNFS